MATAHEQLATFKEFLRGRLLNKEHPLFDYVIKWVRNYPGVLSEKDKGELKDIICHTFALTPEDLLTVLAGDKLVASQDQGPSATTVEGSLRRLLYKGGFYDKYCTYTEHSEAPLAYHLFSALVAVGATVNRRVWFDMGYYKLYPNLSVILLGPSGLKKTSATNIIISILTELELTKIYSEKLTPEQLTEAMKEHAQGIIYAPEMSVFLGRQRYMEGIIPLITRFLDCPDKWSSETIGRGKTTLSDIAISSLMCSTPAWFINNTPEDMVTGGFLPRNVLVVQQDSPRVERIPRPGDPKMRERIMIELSQFYSTTGQVTLTPQADAFHAEWYSSHKQRMKGVEHELLSTYYQRKPDHTLRVAIALHIADHGGTVVCADCFQRAAALLDWTEGFLPDLMRQMFKTATGHSAELVLGTIRAAGGVIDHSELLRKLQHRYNAEDMKKIIMSLKEADLIAEHVDKLQHVYYIKRRVE